MENNFKQQDFEDFLQHQLRNHRMYPADNVWRSIHKKLHGDTRWPALTIGAFAILAVTIFICLYFTPDADIFAVKPVILPGTPNKFLAANNNIINNISQSSNADRHSYHFVRANPQGEVIEFIPETEAAPGVISSELPAKPVLENESRSPTYFSSGVSRRAVTYPEPGREFSRSNLKDPASHLAMQPPVTTNETKTVKNTSPAVKEMAKNNKAELAQDLGRDKVTRKRRLTLQLYVAPSVSYRQLYEDEAIHKGETEGPVARNYVADVNNVVRHRPGTGIEAGLSFLYSMTSRFKVKTGLQFNVRQYNIEAYRSSAELANIALVNGNQLDTINTIAMYRTSNGFYSTDLVNRYYQLSVPVGVEWQILGNSRLQWSVAGTVQPTYLLNRDAYMISTNFKNYTENPGMIRRWNVNSNLETFISFKAGDFRWQVGPQVRYQPYSTFIPQYPIKEHLLDYGLKVGISTGF